MVIPPLPVTFYERIDEPTPLAQTMQWGELVLLLSQHDHSFARKGDVPCFSPAELLPGTTRLKRNVSRVHFGVGDIDHVSPDVVERVIERLKVEDLEFVLVTTWSHSEWAAKGLCSVRVVFPFTRPVEAWEWPTVWARMNVYFEGLLDTSTRTEEKAYFLPSGPAGTEDSDLVEHHTGRPWDVDSAQTQRKVVPPKPRVIGVKHIQDLLSDFKRKKTPYAKWAKEKLTALLEGESLAPPGERDDTIWKVVCTILDDFPEADAGRLAALFGPSIQTMEREARDCPTVANIEEKILRKQTDAVAETAGDLEHSEAERKRMVRAAFDFEDNREHPYTAAELARFASMTGVAANDFRNFWLIQKGASYYVFVNGAYRGPFEEKELEIATRTYLSPAFSVGVDLYHSSARTGGEVVPKDAKRLMRDYGTLAARVDIDMSAQTTYYDPTRRVLVEAPCPLRKITPAYSGDVARWLELLGGESAPKLRDWLSVVTNIQEPCAALYLEGLNGVGKSLFAEGVARLWSDVGSVALADAFASFNSNVIQCPLIFADEAVPKDFRGQSQTGPLRQMIQARTRTLKRKFLTDSNFVGCVRLVLAANNADLIASNEALTVNDIAAIVDRVVHIDATHAHECKAFVEGLGPRIKRFVTHDELAAHALWLRDNHQVATQHRFLVAGDRSKFSRRLTTSSGLRSAVCNWLVGYLLDPVKMDIHGHLLVRVVSGSLMVNVRAMASHWALYSTNTEPPKTTDLANAISGLSTGAKVQLTDGGGNRTAYWSIDTENLTSWAEDNGFATTETLSAALKYDTKGRKR